MHISGDPACHPDDERLGEAVVHAAAAVAPAGSDAAAVAAVLWTADRLSARRRGTTVTGDTYVKSRHGPAPAGFECAAARLNADGSLAGLTACRPARPILAPSDRRLLEEAAAAANAVGPQAWLDTTRTSIPDWVQTPYCGPLDVQPPPQLLNDPADTLPLPPCPPIVVSAPPVTRPRCRALDEHLVEASADRVGWLDACAVLGILPPRRPLLRCGAAGRLAAAARSLPDGYTLVLLDAWRTVEQQQALIGHCGADAEFAASAGPDSIRPPHTTGGAVDVTLAYDGVPLALGTDYDAFAPEAALDACETSPGPVRDLRRLLAVTLTAAGLAGYKPEWWHWSYGDDVWAAARHRSGLYDICSKPAVGSLRAAG